MSDQQFLDKSGLKTLVGNIKAKDTALQNAINNVGNIETHLSSYYYVPCSSSDTDAYEVLDDSNQSWGYWKYVDIKSSRTMGPTPLLIRDIELTPSTSASSTSYNQNNSGWISRYTFNGNFLSRPVFINKVMKNGEVANNPTVKKGTYIYTPDHIMTVGTGHQLIVIKSNHVGGIFLNNWDSGTFISHSKQNSLPQSTMWRVNTANYCKDTTLQQELYKYFKCSWDTGDSWSSNNGYSFGGKMFLMGDVGGIAKGELISTKNGIRLNVFNGGYGVSNKGVYEVSVGKDVPSKYNGIAIVDDSVCTLYTSNGSYKLTKLNKEGDYGFYIDEFKEAIEEIYIEPIWDDYEKLLGSDFNMKSLILKKVTIAQYKGYAPSSTNPPVIEAIIPELDNDGNLTNTVKLQGVNPSGQYVTIVNFARVKEEHSIIGFFTDGIDYRNNIASGWLYYRSEWPSESNPDVGKKIGKIYIKYKTSSDIFDKKEYTIINTYDWYNIENSPHIKNYINSTKSLNEWASNAIKEIYIEKLNFDGTELSTAWQSEDKRTAVTINQYLNFYLERVDYNYTDSENHDGIIFRVKFRSNNMDYSFHVYQELKNELDNIYVIEGEYKQSNLRNTRRYVFAEENLSLTGSWRKVSENEADSWYVSTSSYSRAPTVSFKIYLVLNPLYQPPYKTNDNGEELGKNGNSYVIMEKACNITNAPTIQNYLMTKKMIEESK